MKYLFIIMAFFAFHQIANSQVIEFSNTNGIKFISNDNGKTWLPKKSDSTTSSSKQIIFKNSKGQEFFSDDGGSSWYLHDSNSLDCNNNALNICPNPAKDFIDINLIAETEGFQTVYIKTIDGKCIDTYNIYFYKGNNIIKINVNNLSSGIYMIVIGNSNSIGNKFIKE